MYAIFLFCLNFILLCLTGNSSFKNQSYDGYVSVNLSGQFGNQLFEVATAYAYALDHNLTLTIPDFLHNMNDNIPHNAKKLFLAKIDAYDLPYPPNLKWHEPSFNYSKIPKAENVELHGYFQSEKYFKHRRNEILELLAPPPGLNEEIFTKHPFLNSETFVVGIQIRDYRKDSPNGKYHPTIGRNYYAQAMACFPEETIFLVSSNNRSYAIECLKGLSENIIYLQESDYIEEFYTLVLCNSFIISNSSFGWWASWLSKESNKIVVAPKTWVSLPYNNEVMTKDIFPENWLIID